MSHAKWLAAIVVIVALGTFIPSAQASLVQIDDLTDTLVLYVDGVPVTGNGGRISNYYNPFGQETLQFTFTSDVASPTTFKLYTTMNYIGEEPSDIFMIAGTAGSPNFDIKFVSDLDGGIGLIVDPGYTPSVYDPLWENGDWQTVFELTPDEYQARSISVPEPSTCLMLGTGLLVLYGRLRRKRIA